MANTTSRFSYHANAVLNAHRIIAQSEAQAKSETQTGVALAQAFAEMLASRILLEKQMYDVMRLASTKLEPFTYHDAKFIPE